MWNFDGDKLVSLARDVEKQAATFSDDRIHARSLLMLGSVLDDYGDRREAIRHLERAKLMVSGTLASQVHFWIASVHYEEKRLLEAVDAAEAWNLSKPRNNLVDQAQISFLVGMVLFSADRDTEAWKYL